LGLGRGAEGEDGTRGRCVKPKVNKERKTIARTLVENQGSSCEKGGSTTIRRAFDPPEEIKKCGSMGECKGPRAEIKAEVS